MDGSMRKVRQSIGGLGNIMFKQAYIIGQVLDANLPDVYLQSSEYWKHHADAIRKYFSENISPIDKVALHIRRGDYLKADNFHKNLWETDYYKRAVQLFPNEKFLVFCRDRQSDIQDQNDREWCDQNLGILGIEWELAPTNTDETDDLNLMASCKGIIMANSSFSWWAAFLGEQTKRVVTPKEWFVDGIQRTELLPHWIPL